MSLYGSILMSANTLRANEICLQVVGQNIANANTPGYIRERAILSPAPLQRRGSLLMGMGVEVDAVVQITDQFLENRLRGAISDLTDAAAQEDVYAELETIINELGDADISSMMTDFFSSINEVLNQPESHTARNLSVLQGKTLSEELRRMADRVLQLRQDINGQIRNMADDINRLTEEIAMLNFNIASTEGGDASKSDAVGLRDQRQQRLEDLASLVDITVREQTSGSIIIYSGSNYLVFEAMRQEVEVAEQWNDGMPTADIIFAETNMPIAPSGGKLAGLLAARDTILSGFFNELTDFCGTLIYEFNKLYTRGQGLTGYEELTTEYAVSDITLALNDAGLAFTPENGSFQVMVQDTQTGEVQTSDIFIDLDGYGRDTSLTSLCEALDAIDGITATMTPERKMKIEASSANQVFAFAGDDSGALAALGLNTFFAGSSALSIEINEVVRANPATFAASAGGIGLDTDNALDLAAFLDFEIKSENDSTITEVYERMVGSVTQSSSVTSSTAESARVYEYTLRGQKLVISGVNIDEEVVHMLAYQKSYQAAAKYISVLDELLSILVSI